MYSWLKMMIMWLSHCWLLLNHYGLPQERGALDICFQNLESRGSSHHFNCGNPTFGQLTYHYMAVKFKRINSSLTGKRLFVSLSLNPNRAPSLKLAMENPKWTEGKTSICMSEYSTYIT
ncbi:hypothetical protein F2Q69_00015452 [Brassica cretica]|uniref:Uncharacterized protein n=1 Tax=Brassica cretica TaxID=69181 RepID=A0A8S9QSB1_BRACR|nr:hypothetical protein F2Q69_00015452 [Brassica cretica]